METNKVNARSYANLFSYAQGSYGTGVITPYFASRPFRSDFQRGESNDKNIVFNDECCDSYGVNYKNEIINPKMLRQKKF